MANCDSDLNRDVESGRAGPERACFHSRADVRAASPPPTASGRGPAQPDCSLRRRKGATSRSVTDVRVLWTLWDCPRSGTLPTTHGMAGAAAFVWPYPIRAKRLGPVFYYG